MVPVILGSVVALSCCMYAPIPKYTPCVLCIREVSSSAV